MKHGWKLGVGLFTLGVLFALWGTTNAAAQSATSSTTTQGSDTAGEVTAVDSTSASTFLATVVQSAVETAGWQEVPLSALAGAQVHVGVISGTIGADDPVTLGQQLAEEMNGTGGWAAWITTSYVEGTGEVQIKVQAADLGENLPGNAAASNVWVTWQHKEMQVQVSTSFTTDQQRTITQILEKFATSFERSNCVKPLRIVSEEMRSIKGSYGAGVITLDPGRGVTGETLVHELMHALDVSCGLSTNTRTAFIQAQSSAGSWVGEGSWETRPVEMWGETGVWILYGRSRMPLSPQAIGIAGQWLTGGDIEAVETESPGRDTWVGGRGTADTGRVHETEKPTMMEAQRVTMISNGMQMGNWEWYSTGVGWLLIVGNEALVVRVFRSGLVAL